MRVRKEPKNVTYYLNGPLTVAFVIRRLSIGIRGFHIYEPENRVKLWITKDVSGFIQIIRVTLMERGGVRDSVNKFKNFNEDIPIFDLNLFLIYLNAQNGLYFINV